MATSLLCKLKGVGREIILSLRPVQLDDKHAAWFISRLILVLNKGSRVCARARASAKTLDYNLITTRRLIHSVVWVCDAPLLTLCLICLT